MSESRQEFIEAFVARMVRVAGAEFEDGGSIEEYARSVAPSYWDDVDLKGEGPEACADADMGYWED